MPPERFQAKIILSATRVIIPLPFDPNELWGIKERHHITGSISGHMYRGPLGFDGNQYFLSLGIAWRRETGLDVGDIVEVSLSPEGPQTGTLAEDIMVALNAEPQAREYFEALATFYRKGYVQWIESAKRPETRAARISETVKMLKAGKKQR